MNRIVFLFAMMILSILPVIASSPPNKEMLRYAEWLNKSTEEASDFTFIPENKQAQVRFYLNKRGEVTEPSLWQSSDNLSFDFSCLETVSLLPAFKTKNKGLSTKETMTRMTFDEAHTKTSNKASLERMNQLVLHRIPLSVLIKYPTVFSKAQLLDKKNVLILQTLTGEKQEDMEKFRLAKAQLRKFAKQWVEFFGSSDKTSKEEIEKFADDTIRKLKLNEKRG